MLYNNEDEFLKLLAEKISQVTPKQPANDDWASFDKAYRAHKQKHKNRRNGILIWLTVLSVLLFGIYTIYSNVHNDLNISMVKKNDNKEMIKNEVDIAPFVIEKNQKDATSMNKNDKSAIKIVDNQFIQKNKFENKKGTKINEIKHAYQKQGIQTYKQNELIPKWSNITTLKNGNYFCNFSEPRFINIEKENMIEPKIILVNIDTAKNKAAIFETKSKTKLAFWELGYLLQSNVYKPLNHPSDQYFKGIGVNVGLYMNKNMTFNFGLFASFLNQTEIAKFTFQTTENKIDRIDTTIKYNIVYKRLMMQIDTIISQQNVEHQTNNTYRNNIAFYNLPLQVRYQFGNKKRSFYTAVGVTGTIVYQLETRVKNVGLYNETRQINTNYQLLFAPSLGVGAFQKFNNNWAVYISANYLKYLNGSLYEPNNFQFQTGLQYNF